MVMMKKVAEIVEKRKGNSKNLKGTSCWTFKMKLWNSEKTTIMVELKRLA